ncbi:hypothetical protein Droror1_Dr00016225 [Drosera rotundifolia]
MVVEVERTMSGRIKGKPNPNQVILAVAGKSSSSAATKTYTVELMGYRCDGAAAAIKAASAAEGAGSEALVASLFQGLSSQAPQTRGWYTCGSGSIPTRANSRINATIHEGSC